jgi:hypothetical protein
MIHPTNPQIENPLEHNPMAIILQITYSKKLGLPGFSSHSCSVSLTTEIQDKEMAGEESGKLYQLLQSAVDKEIQQVGWMPEATYGMANSINDNGNRQHQQSNGNGHNQTRNNGGGDRWNCTEGQRGFILRILNENNLTKQQAEDLSQQLFGGGVRLLNKMQASQLIEELLTLAGKPSQPRWRRSQPQTQQPTAVS